jgi:hypothetical protein
MAQDADQVAVTGNTSRPAIDVLEQEIAGTRVRLAASLAALDGEARRLLTPTLADRTTPAEPRDAIGLAAGALRTIGQLQRLQRSGQLKQIGLTIAGLGVGVALLRSTPGRSIVRTLRTLVAQEGSR